MTSNLRRTLQAALAVLAVVWSAAEARAQDLETPDAQPKKEAPAQASSEPSTPTGFGDLGQWVLSVENLFGYSYAHQSNQVSVNAFTVLGDSLGTAKSMYAWPRLALDTMVTKSVSLGLTGSFARETITQANVTHNPVNAYIVGARAGYATMAGPWLGFWPRLGVTYAYQSGPLSSVAVTADALLVVMATSHLLVTFGPELDWGLTGKAGPASVTYWNLGAYIGLTIPL